MDMNISLITSCIGDMLSPYILSKFSCGKYYARIFTETSREFDLLSFIEATIEKTDIYVICTYNMSNIVLEHIIRKLVSNGKGIFPILYHKTDSDYTRMTELYKKYNVKFLDLHCTIHKSETMLNSFFEDTYKIHPSEIGLMYYKDAVDLFEYNTITKTNFFDEIVLNSKDIIHFQNRFLLKDIKFSKVSDYKKDNGYIILKGKYNKFGLCILRNSKSEKYVSLDVTINESYIINLKVNLHVNNSECISSYLIREDFDNDVECTIKLKYEDSILGFIL